MNASRLVLRSCTAARVTLLLAAWTIPTLNITSPLALAGNGADDGGGILRYDPIGDTLVPMAGDPLKPGRLYSHFDPRLKRRVWSVVQSNGEFSHALGEGTIQPAWRLDIRATLQERENTLRRLSPGLAERVATEGGIMFVRLNGNNQWVLVGKSEVASIYNAESGRRWEEHAGRYIPVSHATGYLWTVQSGKYVPLRNGRRITK